MESKNKIVVSGARTNNLKNINITIPKNKLVVITGVSGSGKSSLAFNTIYAEGQRRYIESLSTQIRQSLERIQKPDVDFIKGLSPAIAISQENTNRNPRSTVGTVTEIYDYLKLLYARIGRQTLQENERMKLEPNLFSFNSPYGVCETCKGKGIILEIDISTILDIEKSLIQGAILPWKNEKSQYYDKLLQKICVSYNINMEVPVKELPKSFIDLLLNGIPEEKFNIRYKNYAGKYRTRVVSFEGIIADIQRRFKETPSGLMKEKLTCFMKEIKCSSCEGYRLRKESLSVKIFDNHIGEIANKTIDEIYEFFCNLSLKLNEIEKQVADLLINEIRKRLHFLKNVGLGYLTLDRTITTLSGGEMQRIRLATQISSELSGVLYVLDEPSIGLHQRDNDRLINCLKHLRELGNTVIVVEHDEDIMKEADYLIDIGPGAGEHGGKVIAFGTPEEVAQNISSLTGGYLSGRKFISTPDKRRSFQNCLTLLGCSENNLKNIDVKIPLGLFIAVTGVSGSGKSTLVNEILYKALSRNMNGIGKPGKYHSIEGIELVSQVIKVSQAPIGKTPRSNPATYTGIFDDIRAIFANTKEAKKKGYDASTFSFNTSGGRCEECLGDGVIKFDMVFLADISVVCPSCKGKRYDNETLKIQYQGKSIADVLEMTISEALAFFKDSPKIQSKLSLLDEVGLGYIKLGQPSTTLSGGEAQRIKLATYLHRRDMRNCLYILDEPTTGLHLADIERLIKIINGIVENGNTVIVIEHNLDVIKCADYVIDMGPDGGIRGGEIVGYGTPEEIVKNKYSITGAYLKDKLK